MTKPRPPGKKPLRLPHGLHAKIQATRKNACAPQMLVMMRTESSCIRNACHGKIQAARASGKHPCAPQMLVHDKAWGQERILMCCKHLSSPNPGRQEKFFRPNACHDKTWGRRMQDVSSCTGFGDASVNKSDDQMCKPECVTKPVARSNLQTVDLIVQQAWCLTSLYDHIYRTDASTNLLVDQTCKSDASPNLLHDQICKLWI